jgi:hypothetical protein
MLKKFEQLYIRRMAKAYRNIHDVSIRQAIHKAYEAYEIYREVVEMMDEEYRRIG